MLYKYQEYNGFILMFKNRLNKYIEMNTITALRDPIFLNKKCLYMVYMQDA